MKAQIIMDPKIMTGKPVIRGTRITVELILELLAGGWEISKILQEYPQLKSKDIQAVFQYVSNKIKNEQVLIVHDSPDKKYKTSE